MHYIFSLARIFPFWALPLAFVLAELGVYFRRRNSSSQFVCWGMVAFLGILTICWFIFRGDLNSDYWIKSFER
ncbi:MAG: hypothetical protein CL678_13405 [Bdellovibrionaceae bacterium]|nr:hypothetical protein [Pseudobdellovibrionaceae bacterium]